VLAQNFKTAAELGIPEVIHEGLIKVLGMMERGELRHVPNVNDFKRVGAGEKLSGLFNMSCWSVNYDCGTVCCIGGTINLLYGINCDDLSYYDGKNGNSAGSVALRELFYPPYKTDYDDITVDQAARATRNYLTAGRADWSIPAGRD